MNVCVTGVAGLIGSHVAKALMMRGHFVLGVDNFSGGRESNVPKKSYSYFQLVKRDLVTTKVTTLAEMFRTFEIDVVVHCAATAYEGLSVFSPGVITTNIVGATTNVISACAASHVKKFVNTSSMARYGHIRAPFRESDVPNPVDPYGAAKLFAEKQATMIGELHGVKVVNTVPHSVNGSGQKYDDPFRNVASIMINMMLQGRQPYVYGDGNQKRGFCDVRDVVPIYVRLVEDPFSTVEQGEVINVGPDDESDFITINSLAEMIAEKLCFDLKINYVESRPNEVRLANCSADKIRSRFGFKQKYTVSNTLDEMISEIRSSGTKAFEYEHISLEIIESEKKKCLSTWTNRLF